MNSLPGWTALLALVLWVAGCVAPAWPVPVQTRSPGVGAIPADAPLSITVATGPASAAFAPVWLAVEHGYFARHGLHVDLRTGMSGVNQAQALLAGDIQVGNFGPSELLNARSTGAEVVGVAETIFSPLFELHAAPNFTSVESLRGKTVAITRTGSSNDLAARIILSAHGLTPGPDVTLIQTNDQLQELAALQSGGVDSAVFSPPTNLKATGAGYPSITDVAATGAVLIDLLTVTSRAYTNTHPEGMLAYLAGYVEGLQEFLGNPESSAAIIASYTQSDADTAREGYRVVLPTIDPRPFIREEGLKTIQRFDLSGRLSSVDLAAAHDDTFLAQLQTAGLLDAGGSVPR